MGVVRISSGVVILLFVACEQLIFGVFQCHYLVVVCSIGARGMSEFPGVIVDKREENESAAVATHRPVTNGGIATSLICLPSMFVVPQ